ncbi:MAG: hypothetical protein ABL879_09655 [Devosia sp.]
MVFEFMLAAFIMAIGLAVAAAGTYLYQWRRNENAMLRFDGKNFAGTLGHLAMSFFCGPFIMLQMGWKQEDDGTLSLGSVLIAALVAFGWAFITGLIVLGIYLSILSR